MYLNQFDEKETVRQTGLLTGASRLIGNAWSGTEEGTRGMEYKERKNRKIIEGGGGGGLIDIFIAAGIHYSTCNGRMIGSDAHGNDV